MTENGKLPDYAEVWINAHRARDVYLALSFALIAAAFTQGWKSLQQQSPPDKELPPPPGEAAEHAGAETAMPSKRQWRIETVPFDGECV